MSATSFDSPSPSPLSRGAAALGARRLALPVAIAAALGLGVGLPSVALAQSFPAGIELSALDGAIGFKLNGEAAYDRSGVSVRAAGDVNGDGVDDLVIGAFGASPNGNIYSGRSYVVFGSATGFPAVIDLGSLDGSNGFALNAITQASRLAARAMSTATALATW